MSRAWLFTIVAAAAGCASSNVSRNIGARCTADSDCDDRCLDGSAYPGGLCSVSCATDDDCPVNAHCVTDEGGVCLYTCGSAANCGFLGDGWDCMSVCAQGATCGSGSGSDNGQVMVCRGES